MATRMSKDESRERRLARLEAEAREGREAMARLAGLQRLNAELVRQNDKIARNIYFLQSAVNMPQLYLDREWRITGYSGDFLLVCRPVVGFAQARRHLSEILGEGEFEKIGDYFRRLQALEALPYDQGEPWSQSYEGPAPGEKIGREWVPFGDGQHWKIVPGPGQARIVHTPHLRDSKDCYLMTAGEFGGADTDLRVIYRFLTPEREEELQDVSLVLSASSGHESPLPDLLGYTVCSASCANSLVRIQKQAADQVSRAERLLPATEYEVTMERIGGRITRRLVRVSDGWEAEPLEFIDSYAIYDRQNHLGFSTFSGAADIRSVRIYTRPSRFSIQQFRVGFDAEVQLREPLAGGRLFRLRLGPVYDLNEAFRVLLFEDITERRQVVQALQRSEGYFRSLIENSYEFIVTIAEDGTILYESPSVERQLGYPQGSIKGRNVLDFIHPGDRGKMQESIRKVLEHPERPVSHEMRVRDSLGKWRQVEGIGHNMLAHPAVHGLVINAHDVSARKQTERALLESEERYRNLVELMSDGLGVADPESRFTFVNSALCKMSGYAREEIIGRTPDFLLEESDREHFHRQFELRRQGREDSYESTMLTRNGERKYIHISPRALFDEKGRFQGSVVVLRDITERRLTEEALLRSRAQMRAVIDGIKSRITFVNRDLEMILVNRAAARSIGKPPEELIGKKFCEYWCWPEDNCDNCLPRKTLLSGRSHQATRLMPQQDGRVLDIRTDPVYNREGEMLGAVVISEDITARKRAEELMRQSETRYRLLFENAGNPIVLVDHDGVLQMLNNLAASYLGSTPENLVGKTIFEVVPARFSRQRLEIIRQVIQNGQLLNEEIHLTLNRRRYWFKAIIQPYGFAKGINCAQVILHDITELKEVQRELQRERDRLEVRVLERTAALRRSETRLQERFRELTCLYNIRQEFDSGGTLDEILSRCVGYVIKSLDTPEQKLVTLVLDGREIKPHGHRVHAGETVECKLTVGGRVRGSLHMASILKERTEFLPFELDLVKQAAASLSDFVQNRELQDQLMQSEKLAAAGRVAAGVAHEINNPLGAIKNALFILRHAVPKGHSDYHYLDLMDGEIDRMASIIVQLYDLYKPSSQEVQRIQIPEIVRNVLEMLNTKIARQKIKVESVWDCEARPLFLPRDKVTQVVYNIILNAVQAMPTGGELKLVCRAGLDFLEILVSDTGPGIPADVLAHIFEPFFTTKKDARVPGEGMGMGLALSRSNMESFGGSISVVTRADHGATFSLRFPNPDK